MSPQSRRITVIGGGISGLAAAWRAAQRWPDAQVLVLEAGTAVGGKLALAQIAGLSVDVGAEALLARAATGQELLKALGLADELVAPQTLAARIYAGGKAHGLPPGTMMGVPASAEQVRPSGLFSEATLHRIEAEAQGQYAPLEQDIAVGALVRERLGDEVADRLVEPLLGGVYAGRADGISFDAALPVLSARLRRDGGSLVATTAQVLAEGARHATGGPVFVSLPGGIGRLPQAMAASGAFTVRTNAPVTALERAGTGFRLRLGSVHEPEYLDAEAVILAVPAGKAASLTSHLCSSASTLLGEIETASVAIVTLAYRTEQLIAGAPLPAGSGLLVAPGEGAAVKGMTFSSQKWPGTPPELTLLRASLGRAGESEVLQREDADLIGLARADLAQLIGLSTAPIDGLVTRWGGGLPQYGVGHRERVASIRQAIAHVPGLAICGAAFDGVGIPACIGTAYSAVDQLAQTDGAGAH